MNLLFTPVVHIVLTALVIGHSNGQRGVGQRPNIVFILADDYGFHDIGYHGSRIRTPNLDRLAADGVKLENYYVQPICTPTRSQLMSGRYQIHTGLQHGIIWAAQPNGLPRNSPTMADKLREAGYSTHAVGKWHLGFYKDEFLPTSRGFDSYYGYLTGSEEYFTHSRCYGHGWCGLDLRDNTDPVFTENGTYSAHLFTRQAEQVIRQHAASASSKPLFLYLAYQSVHGPLQVPEQYMEQYQDIEDTNRRTYAGMVTCMDEAVGNVTATLDAAGLLDNTVIVFSTDNGGQVHAGGNNWPLRGWKGSLWEGGMKGVGFVHSKRLIPNKGSINKGFMHVSDWYPTFVEGLAGWSLNGTLPLDGHNQWGSITGTQPSPRTELLHNIDILTAKNGVGRYPGYFDTGVRAAIRVGDMKLITGQPGNGSWISPPELSGNHTQSGLPKGQDKTGDRPIPDGKLPIQNVWLFNITADPEERHDLSDTRQDIVKQLLQKLTGYNATAEPPRYPPDDPACDPRKHGGVWGPWQ
ncbi:arylsulfatase J-like [Littorina saxatilis]|uniref:Sulfatase N-terminal domain-containing protein n=1 Tax=Littorina saxatilis TaxID=31220 RepID=A0AAN9G787_9CAEN